MNSLFSGPLSISDLLQHKALLPLDATAQDTLARIQSQNVTGYSEADVREEIISPLVQVLGYNKQSYFSIERTKKIQLLGRNNFLDYSFTLWAENFWLIEAKRPEGMRGKFSVSGIKQAVGYAVHPEINAALFVLCDGRKFAVFDREENQRQPMLTVDIANLQQDFDKLRAVLSPWQVWFFEKRRIVRHLDKVFDKEFNIRRLEEFKDLVARRLDSKQQTVTENMRSVIRHSGDTDETIKILRTSEPADLIEGAFFLQLSVGATEALAETLVRHCHKSTFQVLHRVFPDDARDMNDHYCMHALNLLIHLNNENRNVHRLPEWLGGGRDLENAIKSFIGNCLTYFASDAVRRGILLCAAGLRRLFKLMMMVDERVWHVGEIRHVLTRYGDSEDSWTQLLSSPERHNLQNLDDLEIVSGARLVRECTDRHGRLGLRWIEARLRENWKAELSILEAIPSYRELVDEKGLEEVFPTEAIDVVYDSLGHGALCIADYHPVWKSYILEHHLNDVETLARIGSWEARKWIGRETEDSYLRLTDETMADRFFLGDVEVYQRLRLAYGYD